MLIGVAALKKQSRISNRSAAPGANPDIVMLILLACAVSLVSFLFYFQREQILLYGDAVAHINIARRVFDSRTPGLLQLGTVWLPLPHLVMIPFLLSSWMWQTGVGGSIPSMIAYVFAVVGIFRLTRGVLERSPDTAKWARAGSWITAITYVLNPNLTYLQSTAMTEALYLALFIWAVVYFAEFLRALQDSSQRWEPKLFRGAACLAGAELTRYDGWFLAVLMGIVVLAMLARRWNDSRFRAGVIKFIVGIAIAPLLWLIYNAAVYGNALEFVNGPYSAKAIERKTSTHGAPAHPGAGNLTTAASYILKASELNMAPGNWGRIWIAIGVSGLLLVFRRIRASAALLLLWTPLIFYVLSIAYGGVPLFLPAWWPYTWYNLRYGLQLLPLFAVSAGLIAVTVPASASRFFPKRSDSSEVTKPKPSLAALVTGSVAVVIVALSYVSVWKAQPLCFKEAWVNSRTKLSLESAVARGLRYFPRDANYLMYLGDHVGAFQQAGVPLKQVINEGNHRPWKKPSDPEGLWEQALAAPAKYVDFVIAFDGDDVDRQVNKTGLTLVTEIHTTGQPHAQIYATRLAANQSR